MHVCYNFYIYAELIRMLGGYTLDKGISIIEDTLAPLEGSKNRMLTARRTFDMVLRTEHGRGVLKQ